MSYGSRESGKTGLYEQVFPIPKAFPKAHPLTKHFEEHGEALEC